MKFIYNNSLFELQNNLFLLHVYNESITVHESRIFAIYIPRQWTAVTYAL